MGNSQILTGPAPVHEFYSTGSWIEGNALRQLRDVAALPGIRCVAAMPDLHAGKFGPVGCAILADGLHPRFAGSDIGCGMALFSLDIAERKLRLDKIAQRMRSLEGTWDGDVVAMREEAGIGSTMFDASLGTIGSGNHFCELQAVEEIVDEDAARRAGIDVSQSYLLVHSGSRGFGHSILQSYLAEGQETLPRGSELAAAYLHDHDHAVSWAKLNRRIIAVRAAEAVRADYKEIADLSHNLIEPAGDAFLHRKGAAPSDRGFVPIPGSRGTLSYLVEPVCPAPEGALASLAHGAGRKFNRGAMHGRVRTKKSDLARLARNPFGGYVICEDRELLVEEAPEAYKSAEGVIADLAAFGLARIVASLRPLVTFKTAGGGVSSREQGKNLREHRR